jgi:uncharacterized protein YrrD
VLLQAQNVIGLPALLPNGRSVGRVEDVWFDEFWHLAGIVLETGFRLRRDARVVETENVLEWGDDALMIRSREAVVSRPKNQLFRTFHSGVIQLKEMPVYTEDGQELGRVSDVYFRPQAGTPLIGYELTDGFLADVLEGRRRLFLPDGPDQITLGEDAILVPVSFGRILERDHTGKETGEDR